MIRDIQVVIDILSGHTGTKISPKDRLIQKGNYKQKQPNHDNFPTDIQRKRYHYIELNSSILGRLASLAQPILQSCLFVSKQLGYKNCNSKV